MGLQASNKALTVLSLIVFLGLISADFYGFLQPATHLLYLIPLGLFGAVMWLANREIRQRQEGLKQQERQLRATQNRLWQAGKMTVLGQLGASIAHEMSQPLAAIRGFAQLLLDEWPKDNPHWQDLKRIEEQSIRLSRIVNNIRTFSRQSHFDLEPVDIHNPIEDAYALLSTDLKRHHIRTHFELMSDLPKVSADANQLQQIFINLLTNARDALSERDGGDITITTGQENGQIIVRVQNNGPAIPSEIMRQIFNPFFTTKEAGVGTGLGLAITYSIIKDHQGDIRVSSDPGSGVCFEILLPKAPDKIP